MSFLKEIGGIVLGVVGAVVGFVLGGPAGAAIGASIGFGIGSAAQMAAMRASIPETSTATTGRLSTSMDLEAYRKIVFGETALGTDLRYWEVWGSDGDNIDQVIAAAGHEIESFGALYFEDELITFSGDNATGAYAGALSKADRTVGVTGTALTVGAGTLWTSNASFTGCAHYALKFVWSQEKYPRGIPSRVTRVGKGAKVYDPRLDSTRGGSGSHRADDQSTWEYSPTDSNGEPIGRNPVLQALWYQIGWRVTNPSTSEAILVCGVGRPLDDIDFESFATAANDAEAAEYYSDCLLSTGDAHETNIAVLEAACAGKMLDSGGRIGFKILTDTTGDIVQALSDADVVDGKAVTWRPRLALSEIWNQAIGSFPDPAALYQLTPLPKVRDTAYETADGFKKTGPQFRFDAVQDPDQCQRLMRLELNRTRFQGVLTAPFNWRAKKLRIWDMVTLDFPELEFSEKLFRVILKKTDPLGAIWLLLREDDPAIYAGGTITPVSPPAAGAGYDPRVVVAPDAGDWTVTPQYISGGGAQIPSLTVEGEPPSAAIVATHIYFRQGVSADWIYQGRFGSGEPVIADRAALAPNVAHYVKLVYENAHGVRSAALTLGPYTSPAEFTATEAVLSDGIVGQGPGATAAAADVLNSYVATGVNRLVDHDFRFSGTYWRSIASAGSVSSASNETLGVRRRTLTGSGVTVGQYIQLDSHPDRQRFTCAPGDRVEASAYVSAANLSSASIFITWYSAADAVLGYSSLAAFTPGSATASLADFVRFHVFGTAPAGTAYAFINVRGTASTTAPVLHVAKPMMAIASASQTTPTAWNPGLDNAPGADVTINNTAAAITGQGPGATAAAADVLNDALRTGTLFNAALPDRPAIAADFTGSQGSGTPASIAALSVGTIVNVANEGDVMQFASNTALSHRGWLPVVASQTYRIRARVRVTVDGTGNQLYAQFVSYNAAGTVLSAHSSGALETDFVAADGWIERELLITGAAILAGQPTAAFIRARIYGGRNTSNAHSGATWQAAWLRLEDVTDELTSRARIVDDFTRDGFHWTTAFGGAPGAQADPTGATYQDVANVGRTIRLTNLPKYLQPKGIIRPAIGRRYLVIADVAVTTDATAGTLRAQLYVNGLSSGFSHGAASWTSAAPSGMISDKNPIAAADGEVRLAAVFTCTALGTYDAYWRPRVDLTRPSGSGGTIEVRRFRIIDVTDGVVGRLISGLLRDDGSTPITEAAIITASGTAAAVTGQGNQATRNHNRGATGSRPTATGSGDLYTNTTTNTVQMDTAAGVWTDIATLSTAVQPRGRILGPAAATVNNTSTWNVVAQVDLTDIPASAVLQAPYVDAVGQSQSGISIGAGWQWRLCEAPTSSPSTKTVLKSGNISLSAGASLGGGLYEPPTVDSIDQPSAALVALANSGAVRYTIEVRRTSGTSDVGIQLTANFIINPT